MGVSVSPHKKNEPFISNYRWNNPVILTLDPKLLGHPSSWLGGKKGGLRWCGNRGGIPGYLSCVSGGFLVVCGSDKKCVLVLGTNWKGKKDAHEKFWNHFEQKFWNQFYRHDTIFWFETPEFWDAVHCPAEAHSCKTGTMNPIESCLQNIAPSMLLSKKSPTGPTERTPKPECPLDLATP